MYESQSSRPCGPDLDAKEREQTSIGLAQGLSGRAISRQLKRSASTISREKLRHQVRQIMRACCCFAGDTGRSNKPSSPSVAAGANEDWI